MRILRRSKVEWQRCSRFSNSTSKFRTRPCCVTASSSEPRWNARVSAAVRARKSLSSLSSRAEKSCTSALSRSTSASTSLTPGILFTIAPHFIQQFIEFFDHHDSLVHARKQFDQVTLFEFITLGVLPIGLGFLPAKREFFADRRQPAFAAANSHEVGV